MVKTETKKNIIWTQSVRKSQTNSNVIAFNVDESVNDVSTASSILFAFK